MKKKDLKTGHVVEYKNGERRFVLKDSLDGLDYLVHPEGSYACLNAFSEDLIYTNKTNGVEVPMLVIMKVYEPLTITDILKNPIRCGKLIWERKPEEVEMQIKINGKLEYSTSVSEEALLKIRGILLSQD